MELTIEQALQQGIAAHKEGKLQDAERLYRAILQSQPTHPDANHNLGVLAVSVNKADAALPLFKAALEANPKIEQFWLSYIDALIKEKQFDNAKRVLSDAQQAGVTAAKLQIFEERLESGNQLQNHKDELSPAIELRDLRNETINKAVDLRESGKFDDAIKLLKDSIREFPNDADFPAILSHCYILNDELEEAVKNLEKARDIDPNCPLVGWNEARLLLKNGEIPDALAIARNTNKRFPDDVEGMGVLGSCLRVSNEISESIELLNKAIKLNPNYAEALVNRGLIKITDKDNVGALADLEEAFRIKPFNQQISALLVSLKMELEQFAEAIEILKNC